MHKHTCHIYVTLDKYGLTMAKVNIVSIFSWKKSRGSTKATQVEQFLIPTKYLV